MLVKIWNSNCSSFFSGDLDEARKEANRHPNSDGHRPIAAFMVWLAETRGRLMKQHPSLSSSQLARIAGVEWMKVEDKTVGEG